jgi:hypothetical protein
LGPPLCLDYLLLLLVVVRPHLLLQQEVHHVDLQGGVSDTEEDYCRDAPDTEEPHDADEDHVEPAERAIILILMLMRGWCLALSTLSAGSIALESRED